LRYKNEKWNIGSPWLKATTARANHKEAVWRCYKHLTTDNLGNFVFPRWKPEGYMKLKRHTSEGNVQRLPKSVSLYQTFGLVKTPFSPDRTEFHRTEKISSFSFALFI
jgi:hypothetical protein